jgi:alkylation response protein AidB-like acyl-CoA dehydrogenase
MDFAFSEEQEMLRSAAHEFLARECPSAYVRRAADEAEAHDPTLWSKLAEMGWTGLGIPEAQGGAGGFLDLVVVLEEAGRALLPGPFFSTVALFVPALVEAGSEAQRAAVLPGVAAGEARGTLAVTEPAGRWDAGGVQVRATPTGGGFRLEGVKLYVPDAGVADHLVIPARTGGDGEEGITLFLVSGRPPGLTVSRLETLDATRPWYEVRLEGLEVSPDAVLGSVGGGWAPLQRTLERGAAALCAEMVGGSQWVLDTSVEYAKTRHQFGKPIGIYQAVSHKLADMLLETESSRSATYYAAWAVEADAPDRSAAVSIAKAYTSDAYRKTAGNGIQVHGGIGFTWEHDLHLYFKRAKASEVLLGDATYHRELVAEGLDL